MILVPTPQDVMRVNNEAGYFEAIYPLFYISSSIICRSLLRKNGLAISRSKRAVFTPLLFKCMA